MLADEPTTALDVTIQAQVLKLMADLKQEIGTSIVLITHDLGVVARNTQRVVVMYAGVVVEEAQVNALFAEPLHPYTQGLMRSIPRIGASHRRQRLSAIEGTVPSLQSLPPGCRFSDRCPQAFELCRRRAPPLAPPAGGDATGRKVRCWLHVEAS
jgi:oligopeptide/dipeptide ABC transporter ATP-binding protein